MAYPTLCSPDNIPDPGSIYFFHESSRELIEAVVQISILSGCPVVTTTGNTPPQVETPEGNFFIPISTPFTLEGNATDADGDSLTFSWEQHDLGHAPNINSPTGDAPIFRTFNPVNPVSYTHLRAHET